MYDVRSSKAEEFINHEEILATLQYAEENKENRPLLDAILEKAKTRVGLNHREAMVLLECPLPEYKEKLFALAKEIKQAIYGNRIVLFAPLYLSNYCINGCVYCPYHAKNKTITRKKLNQDQVREEVMALEAMGHKRIVIESGEHPLENPLEYILECIDTIYSIKKDNGEIRRVNVNIAACEVEDYRKLHEAGIGTYTLFQETYNKENYEALHPTGPKSDYAYHTTAMDRAMEAGIDDVGIGVLYGLEHYKYDFVGLIMSTRESQAMRERGLALGISQISGGSRTSVGGYVEEELEEENSAQFDTSDRRSLDEIVEWLLQLGYVPSFCTACYREGRTGDRFMALAKSGQISNCCQPNALMTLKEYLLDYADEETKAVGAAVIDVQLDSIKNDLVKEKSKAYIAQMEEGERDFRF